MLRNIHLKFRIRNKEQGFYLFLLISAFCSTLAFGFFYFYAGAHDLAKICLNSFLVYVVLSLLSYTSIPLVFLFRASISTALISFFVQTMMTGGVYSPSISEFIIIPLLAYFYRPISDRYVFFFLSAVSIILVWYLSNLGYVQYLNEDYLSSHAVMVTFFVFIIVAIFSFLFRDSIASRNKLLSTSMSELKEATQKLVQSEKMASLGLLAAGVAHEINNPLNFIKGGIEGLANELKEAKIATANSNEFISHIHEGVNRTSVIVNSLGNFSRKSDDMQEHCDIHMILENCLVMLQHRLKFKVEIVRNFHNDKIILIGNEGKLHQAFINFFVNSEQAMDGNGTIWLATKILSDGGLEVTISDNGKGISHAYIERLSEPFFTTKVGGSGVGLGLTITYQIIEDHKGKIEVTSATGTKSGTKFTISWPSELILN
jgi:signal transduction histidine kinase